MHFGILEGRFRDRRDREAHALWQQWRRDRATMRMPGGEGLDDLERRVIPCLERIRADGGVCLVVAHRSVVRVALGHLLGWSSQERSTFDVPHHTLFRVEVDSTPTLTVQRFDRT